MSKRYEPIQIPGAGWAVVERTGNRMQRRAGTHPDKVVSSEPHTLTLAQAQATADAMRRDGRGEMYTTDTRCAFVDWLDSAERSGRVSPALAQRFTLRS